MTDIDTRYNIVRTEFYRLWSLAQTASKQARIAQKEGNEAEAQAAFTAFRVLSKQAREAYAVLSSMKEPRPAIIEARD